MVLGSSMMVQSLGVEASVVWWWCSFVVAGDQHRLIFSDQLWCVVGQATGDGSIYFVVWWLMKPTVADNIVVVDSFSCLVRLKYVIYLYQVSIMNNEKKDRCSLEVLKEDIQEVCTNAF